MITLVLDTALDIIIIALVKNNQIIYHFKQQYDKNMSKHLVNEVNNAFLITKIKPRDISNIVVGVGPGSFTGVRMGVTVAKTLAFALDKPIYPISTLYFMATTLDNEIVMPLIDARRGYVYGAIFDENNNFLLEEKYIKLDDIKLLSATYKDVKIISYMDIEGAVKPEYNIIETINRAFLGGTVNVHNINPNYLKITQAESELKLRNDS